MSESRYSRQMALAGFGEHGQAKLKGASVLVIGAGGLGSPVLLYLTGAGIGQIGVADADEISLSNLHRQVLYATKDAGLAKVHRAGEVLKALNPEISIITHEERIDTKNAERIISSYDIVVDGTDNFASRYLINDACVLFGKPLVYGAISRFEGQIAIFNAHDSDQIKRTNYRDLFPNPPSDQEVLNCTEDGVLGTLPGIIGTMMANEVIKLITGLGNPLINKLLTYNSLTNQIYELEIIPSPASRALIPKNSRHFEHTDYELLCSSRIQEEVAAADFEYLAGRSGLAIIDVREFGELPDLEDLEHLQIPLSLLETRLNEIKEATVILFCQTGKRSRKAATILAGHFGNSKKIYSLKGGINAWENYRKGDEG